MRSIEGRHPRRQRIENALNDPAIWKMADCYPDPEPSAGGRPRSYPAWVIMLYETLIHEFRSAVAVEVELADPDVWRLIAETGRRKFPNDPTMWPPPEPIRRHHYTYAKARYLLRPDVSDSLAEVLRDTAAALAVDMGLCDPTSPKSWTHPALEDCIAIDGKVITARTRRPRLDKSTGEIRKRCDPDIEKYTTGGGHPASGIGFVIAAARKVERNQRVILDIEDSPLAGGEMLHAMRLIERTCGRLPGAVALLYDGAMRGKHRRQILKWGKIPVSPPRSKDNPTPKERHLGQEVVRFRDGTEEAIQLHLKDGAPYQKELAEDGTPLLTRLERVKTTRPVAGTGRCYSELRIEDAHRGEGVVRVRHNSDREDERVSFNREEWLHVIAPGDADWYRIYSRRNDAESGNNSLDASLQRERAHSIGRPGIRLNLISWAVYRNAQARALHLERAGPHDAAA